MALTAQDVRDVQFTVTHLHGGYSTVDVDAFLTLVERALEELAQELERSQAREAVLRTELARLQRRVDYLETSGRG